MLASLVRFIIKLVLLKNDFRLLLTVSHMHVVCLDHMLPSYPLAWPPVPGTLLPTHPLQTSWLGWISHWVLIGVASIGMG